MFDKETEKIIKAKKFKKRAKNTKLAVALSSVFGFLFTYVIYSEIGDGDGFTRDEAYEIKNVAIKVNVDDNYTSKILNGSVDLLIYGDDKKVANMKDKNKVPEIVVNLKGKDAGEYEVEPVVKDDLIGVNYEFSPSLLDVEVIEAIPEKYLVLEHGFGVANEGYYVEKIVANEEAVLLVTEETKLEIGNIIAELDVTGVSESGVYPANIIVLDKRGKVLDIPLETEQIQVTVTYSELTWKTITKDIATLTEEISVLESELETQKAELEITEDVLRRTDLQKEIDFRTTRLAEKNATLAEKEQSLIGLKEKQETEKKDSSKKSVLNGGLVSEE